MIPPHLLAPLLTFGLALQAADDPPGAVPELADRAQARARAGRWAEAAGLWERVVARNPVNAGYWERLGSARYQAGDHRRAIPAYERALQLGAGFPWGSAYQIARCHARLGDKRQALAWLEKAFALGYRSLDEAREDPDLRPLHGEPRFRELVALVDAPALSRTDGWRYDLKLLVRELRRLHYHLSKRPAPPGLERLVRKLHDDIPKLGDHQIEVAFMKLMRLAGDGHTEIAPTYYYLPDEGKALPVRFYLFEEGLFVVSASAAHKDLAGARVLRFGDQAVDRVREALAAIISRDNDMWVRHVAPAMMRQPQLLHGLGLIPDGDRVALTVRDGQDRERTVVLPARGGKVSADWVDARARAPGPAPLYLKNRDAAYWFEYLPASRTVFFQFNRVRDDPKEPFEKFCGRLFAFIDKNAVERLVIDARWNSGGDNTLLGPLVRGLVRCDKVNRRGKLFVIIGRNTFSAAQCAVTWIERCTNAVFVGEPTGSSPNFVGETVPLKLPYSKMLASISDLYWQNAVAEDNRTWLAPQIYTPPTFAAYVANRDPALEAILKQ